MHNHLGQTPQEARALAGYRADGPGGSMDSENRGEYQAFSWPGGYANVFYAADMGTFCADCANGKNGSQCAGWTRDGKLIPLVRGEDDEWIIIGAENQGNVEPSTEICIHCGAVICSGDNPEPWENGDGWKGDNS